MVPSFITHIQQETSAKLSEVISASRSQKVLRRASVSTTPASAYNEFIPDARWLPVRIEEVEDVFVRKRLP